MLRFVFNFFLLNQNIFIYTHSILHPQGLYIRFRDLSGGSQKYNIMTVLNPSAGTHVVINLKKYTKYEFFIAPFYRSVEGQPSNSKIIQTFEDSK